MKPQRIPGWVVALFYVLLGMAVIFLMVRAVMAKTPELFDSGVPRDESRVLADLYAAAQKRLQEIVLHPKGLTAGSREFRRARAAAQLQQVDGIVAELKAASSTWAGRNVPAVYAEGRRIADKQAREAGVRPKDQPVQGSFHLIDRPAVKLLARDIAVDLSNAADSMGKLADKVLRQTAQMDLGEGDIDRILAGGIIEGNPRETIRTLAEALRKVSNGGMITAGSMTFDARYYAEMVVRTKTREVVVTARHERLEEVGLDLVMIVGRVSKYPCTMFLGKVYSLSGKSRKYPAYDSLPSGGPPFHPNCSKGTRPFVEELATDKQIDGAVPDADTNKAMKLAGGDFNKLARPYQDLQLQQQVRARYATTQKKLFG